MEQKKISCKELRNLFYKEWQRFTNYTKDEVRSYIRKNYICSEYTVKTLSKEFAGR